MFVKIKSIVDYYIKNMYNTIGDSYVYQGYRLLHRI